MFCHPNMLWSVEIMHFLLLYRQPTVKSAIKAPNFAHENQAIKRQKLEDGKSRQVDFYLSDRMCTCIIFHFLFDLAYRFHPTCRFLTSNLRLCCTKHELELLAAVPPYSLRLQKLIKRIERFAITTFLFLHFGIYSNFGCCESNITLFSTLKMYVREPIAPFVSTAEMLKKFQSSTREMSLSRMSSSTSHVIQL